MADKVITQEADFAVIGSAFDTEKLISNFWIEDELVTVLPAGCVLSKRKDIKIEDLYTVPMIIREQGYLVTAKRWRSFYGIGEFPWIIFRSELNWAAVKRLKMQYGRGSGFLFYRHVH